jgi:P-type E1-E2 ATPase
LAVFGLQDDLRPDVKESIAFAASGGINVRMVSGDNIHTARYQAI